MNKLDIDMTDILVASYTDGVPTPMTVLSQFNLSLNDLSELINDVVPRSTEHKAILFFVNLTRTKNAAVYKNINVVLNGPPILTVEVPVELPFSLNPWYRRRLPSGPCSLCDYLNIFDS